MKRLLAILLIRMMLPAYLSAQTTIVAGKTNGIFNPTQYPGSDIGAQIMSTIAAACNGVSACTIAIPPNPSGGCYAWTTKITSTKLVNLRGAGASATCLNWTGASNVSGALTINGIISGGGYPASITNLTLCYNGCTAQSSTATGMAIGPGGGPVSQVIVDGVNVFGWNTGISISNAAFDISINNSTMFYNATGLTIGGISVPVRVTNSNITGNTTAGIAMTGNGASLVLNGNDIETNGIGLNVTANVFVWGVGNHWENPASSAGSGDLYIKNSASNSSIVISGGEMLEDALTGTAPEFILDTGGDYISVNDVSVTTLGAAVTNTINTSGGGGCSIHASFRNGQPASIGDVGGSGTCKLQDNPSAITLNPSPITWNGYFLTMSEQTCSGVSPLAGQSRLCSDSSHTFEASYNGGSFLALPQTVCTGTATSAGTAVNAGTSQTLAVTCTGATTSDVATCATNTAYPATWQTGIEILPPVVTSNTVTITLSNPSAGNITPVAQTFACKVVR